MLKIAVAICTVLQRKFMSEIETVDGLKLIKKAREHVSRDEVAEALKKVKISQKYVKSLFALLR